MSLQDPVVRKPVKFYLIRVLRILSFNCFSVKVLSLVHTSDEDGSTKSHTNPVKQRMNRRKQTLPFYSILFRLRFAGFMWNFLLPAPSPSLGEPSFKFY